MGKSTKRNRKHPEVHPDHRTYLGTVRNNAPAILPELGVPLLVGQGLTQEVVKHEIAAGGCGARTLVYVHSSEINSGFAFTCSGCGKRVQFDRIGQTQASELMSAMLHAYGDESKSKTDDVVVYGIVAVASATVDDATHRFARLLAKMSGSSQSRFHCRKVFNEHARAKFEFRRFAGRSFLVGQRADGWLSVTNQLLLPPRQLLNRRG